MVKAWAAAAVGAAMLAATAAWASDQAGADGGEHVILAGGCFWCVEADFDKVEGVLATVSGYTGGTSDNPTYEQVTYGDTGHYEAVKITYDPEVVTFRELVDHFWRTVDPLDAGGQFCDRGDSYRTAVFVDGQQERAEAEASKAAADALIEGEILTPILEEAPFWPAEGYHQDYYLKNPLRYRFYRLSCGRDARIDEIWGDVEAPRS